MHIEQGEYPFHYVILRYVPDFAREEFVNGGIVFFDVHEQRILSKICNRRSKYNSIDHSGHYKLFLEATERWINGLVEEVKEIKEKRKEMESEILVEKAFLDAVIPNAGFLGFSNIRSGVTNNVLEKFDSLYQRYVDDIGDIVPAQVRKPETEVKSSIIDLFLEYLREDPHAIAVPYDATKGIHTYLFDTSFVDNCNVLLRTVRVRPEKNGTVEWGSVLENLIVLSDLKVEHPNYTFGILLDFSYEDLKDDQVKRITETIASLTARFKRANVDLVLANRKEVEHYLMINGLLKNIAKNNDLQS